jgi:hypothetical protein
MISEARWKKEMEIMRSRYPWITPFETVSGFIGFCGYLRGPRSKRLFEVLIKIPARMYPEREPPVYIEPKLTTQWWRVDDVNQRPEGRLCYHRMERGKPVETHWDPAHNTFANVLGFAIQYLQEFDR